jgi:hypothetical protein
MLNAVAGDSVVLFFAQQHAGRSHECSMSAAMLAAF